MRLELKGEGQPDPIFALPDPGIDSTLPPLTLSLPHGQPFLPGPYIEQGYTRYEVWCVGGAGGHGGDAGLSPEERGPAQPTYTTKDFALRLYWPYYFSGGVTHYHDPYIPGPVFWGGAGGGGGMHVVSGLLVSLPGECPVVVGQAGADAPLGQFARPDAQTPVSSDIPNTVPGDGHVYDLPHPTFSPPVNGGDGGASSFNGSTCRASGGKGGHAATKWLPDSEGGPSIDADGGRGGLGNQTAAGGGGSGGYTVATHIPGTGGGHDEFKEVMPVDGTWDGAIGKGGGGGRGGLYVGPESGPGFGV